MLRRSSEREKRERGGGGGRTWEEGGKTMQEKIQLWIGKSFRDNFP